MRGDLLQIAETASVALPPSDLHHSDSQQNLSPPRSTGLLKTAPCRPQHAYCGPDRLSTRS